MILPGQTDRVVESLCVATGIGQFQCIRNEVELEHRESVKYPGEIDVWVSVSSHSDQADKLKGHDKGHYFMADFAIVYEERKYYGSESKYTHDYADGHVLIISNLTKIALDKPFIFEFKITGGLCVRNSTFIKYCLDKLQLNS